MASAATARSKKTAYLARLVDEYGAIHQRIARLKLFNERAGILREQIEEILQLRPDQAAIAEGEFYSVPISEKAKTREIVDMAGIEQALGHARFLEACSFALGKADELLTKEQRDRYIAEYQNTGPRVFKVVPKLRRR